MATAECLSHMSVGGEVTDFQRIQCSDWNKSIMVDCSMLEMRHSYTLFHHIELKVWELLPHILLASAMPFSKSALTKDALVCEVVHDEDIQFCSSILSVDLEEDNEPNNS